MISFVLSNQCMSNPFSISYSSARRFRPPLPYPDFHLRDLQNSGTEDETDRSGFDRSQLKPGPKWTEVAHPKFKIGSLVKITKDFDPQSQVFPDLTAKGWRGRVEEVVTDGRNRFFIISLDSITLKRLRPTFVQEMVEEGERDNPFLFEIPEDYLEAAAPKDTEEEALQLQRLTYHTYFWGNIKKDTQAARMFKILTRDPFNDDLGNWLYHFQHQVDYPIEAEVEGLLLEEIAPGTKVKILGVEGLSHQIQRGLIGTVQKGRAILSYPLMELLPLNEDDPTQQPLSDYRYWADFSLV